MPLILGPLINIAHADVYQPQPQVYYPYPYHGAGKYLPPLGSFSPLVPQSFYVSDDGLLQNLVLLNIL